MNIAERKHLMLQEFNHHYGASPTVWARAPGRVDLMGSHTDYNQGYVLTLSIDRDTWIAARPRTDQTVSICSLNLDGSSTFDLNNIVADKATPWSNYVRGVAAVLQEEGYALTGFDGLIHSTVPVGSNLSSSAALEVSAAIIFEALDEWQLEPVQRALLCQRAENQFVGVNCGILDQYASAMGQEGCALLLDCRDLSSRPVPVAGRISVVICDTRAKRELTGSEYDERRVQCEEGARLMGVEFLRDVTMEHFLTCEPELPEVVARRSRFIIQENQRVLDLAQALPTGDRAAIQALTADSFAGSRDLYEISSLEMAAMMDAMLSGPGVIGARQAGAGFGGCMVAFVQDDRLALFADHVEHKYNTLIGIQPRVYPVQAASGAGLLQF